MKSIFKKYPLEISTAGVLFLAYVPVFLWMWDRWFAIDSYYSHGILVPFVSGYLLWQKRGDLSRIARRPSRWGVPLVISGALIYALSSIFRIYFSSAFSLLLVLAGLVLHFYGKEFFRAILFPFGFLFFMMPLPLFIIVNLSFKLKLFAAEIARWVLRNMGFSVFRDGSILRLPHTQVVVDDVCSGLRSLISLTALSAIFAFWFKGPAWKRIILFVSAIPIAVVTNVCRVVFLSFVSEVWGPEYATGFVHDFSGFMIFALAFVMLWAIQKIIE